MMQSFSQRTVTGLKDHTLFRLALPPFRSFLDINVDKEVSKDRTVILQAASLLQSGTRPGPAHVDELLSESRKVDESFVAKASAFPITIQIQYHDIEHYRRQRIQLLLQSSFRILDEWQQLHSFRRTIHGLYDKTQFRQLLLEILHLYAMETRMLSRSISLPSLISLGRDAITQTVNKVMQREAEALASILANSVYQRSLS